MATRLRCAAADAATDSSATQPNFVLAGVFQHGNRGFVAILMQQPRWNPTKFFRRNVNVVGCVGSTADVAVVVVIVEEGRRR